MVFVCFLIIQSALVGFSRYSDITPMVSGPGEVENNTLKEKVMNLHLCE